MTIQRLDISMANTPDIEINGIQACIAGDDFTYATFPIDMARKYGKKIYLTDMVDFPYGLYSGFDTIYKGYIASVQHGMDGIFGYCWYANWPPSYNYYEHLTKPQMDVLISDTQKAIKQLDGFALATQTSFLMPLMSYSLADPNGRKGDNLDCFGLYHLVLDSGFMPDVLTTYELSKSTDDMLSKYKVVFLPDCPVLTQENSERLKIFIENGGIVVSSGSLPKYDLAYEKLSTPWVDEKKQGRFDLYAEYAFGQGKVVNFYEKVGRSYMGLYET
jgi:hypothetical protein